MRLAVAIALAGITVGAHAQTYPTKPIRFVVPFAAGGGSDLVARTVAQKITEALGQPVIVDNRAGAAGTIGADIAAKSPPDGHTLLLGSNGPLAINPSLYAKLPYDAARDFAPVSLATVMPFLLVVHPSLPVRNVKELIALAKSKPGQLNYGSPGNGSTTHLANELLKSMTGMQIAHVPYKGVAPAAIDLMSGQVQMMSGDLSTLLPHVRSGKMRAIAVTAAHRSSLLPDMPTVAESGVPGYDASGWFGVLVPAGTPRAIVERLNVAIAKGLATNDARVRLGALGGEVAASTPEQFGAYVRTEAAKWGKLIKTLGLKAEEG
ncbi:MAG TPA: tripartite tricarboxylate transporter substrate binding protein [Burkholderiales bacterium]|jgi:tripartite-type tricarboxylate transporter receptor subunit TctC|nr:tripartite tricarboxylate transporter substrate binding protein [Burkholderiales bacterium]